MSERKVTCIVDSDLLRVFRVGCRAPRLEPEQDERTGGAELIVPLRGLFVVRVRGQELVADTRSALVLAEAEEYRVAHPISGGDDCGVLVLPTAILEEALGHAGSRVGAISAETQLAVRLLVAGSACGDDALAAEETLLRLLRVIARDMGSTTVRPSVRVNGAQLARVDRVRALLASDPRRSWRLGSIARSVGASPYHLARLFRAATGESIHRYLVRLRLSVALDRLEEGASDLAALATELGFAHHSHFSLTFRAAFGLTPAAARRAFTARGSATLDEILRSPRTSVA